MGDGISEYQQAISALFARTGTTAKLGLERTRALLAQLGNPERRYPCFHVAGTNGKGSVVAMLDALLRDKGLKVGRYTSPHLVDFRERIAVNGVQIGEAEVLRFLHDWEGESDRLGATFFELTTVLAFQHFARAGVDVAVIETGMGGRLDATNVIMPVVTGITSVAFDHMEYLGQTIEEIAREKAGIVKPQVPAVIAPLADVAVREVRRCAAAVGAPIVEAIDLYRVVNTRVTGTGTEVEFAEQGRTRSIRIGLVGREQGVNTAVALAMLHMAGDPYRVTLDAAGRVLRDVHVPGRFQRIGKFVIDVAHNVEGTRALAATLAAAQLPRPITAVVGILQDKQWEAMLQTLAPQVDSIVLTTADNVPLQRQWDPERVAASWASEGHRLGAIRDLGEALAAAERDSGTVVVTGSFYTAGEALQVLGAAGTS